MLDIWPVTVNVRVIKEEGEEDDDNGEDDNEEDDDNAEEWMNMEQRHG